MSSDSFRSDINYAATDRKSNTRFLITYVITNILILWLHKFVKCLFSSKTDPITWFPLRSSYRYSYVHVYCRFPNYCTHIPVLTYYFHCAFPFPNSNLRCIACLLAICFVYCFAVCHIDGAASARQSLSVSVSVLSYKSRVRTRITYSAEVILVTSECGARYNGNLKVSLYLDFFSNMRCGIAARSECNMKNCMSATHYIRCL